MRTILAISLLVGLLGLCTRCSDPNRDIGARCFTAADCDPALICSNRDQPDELGVCVLPEALPDAAVSSDASP